MERGALELRIGGHCYRVVTSADEDRLRELEGIVQAKLAEINRQGRPLVPDTLFLAAIALANDLVEERARAARAKERHREALHRVLQRVDAALDESCEGARVEAPVELRPEAPS